MRSIVVISVLVLLAGCQPEPAEKPEQNNAALASVNVAPVAERSDDPTAMKQAFAAAFPEPTARIGDDTYSYTPAALYRLKDKWVLLSEGRGPDCHACAGWLSVHYLERGGDGFKLMKGWADAVPGTSFGGPPEWKVRTDLMSAPVVESTGGGTWQGYTCSVGTLTELTPDGPKARAKQIPLVYSDAGAIIDESQKPKEMEGRIGEGQRGKSFVVHYSGAVTRDVSYTLKGDAFEAGAGAKDIPTC